MDSEHFKTSEFMNKLIELLIIVNVNPNFLLEAIINSYFVNNMTSFYSIKNAKEKKNIF